MDHEESRGSGSGDPGEKGVTWNDRVKAENQQVVMANDYEKNKVLALHLKNLKKASKEHMKGHIVQEKREWWTLKELLELTKRKLKCIVSGNEGTKLLFHGLFNPRQYYG